MATKTITREAHREEDVMGGRIDHLIEHRLPWLIAGLLGGLVTTLIIAKYEAILAADLRLVFFIPIIVYLSGAVGAQTATIYVRALAGKKQLNFMIYLAKESGIGFGLGILGGAVLGVFVTYWLGSYALGAIIALTMLINLTIAPALAVLIPNLLYKRRADPALGAGPLAAIIQDLISLLVYFAIASIIIL